MEVLLLSKNCGILYHANQLKGLKTQQFWRKTTTYAGIAFVLYLSLLLLFVKQSKRASSRRALNRLSWWTFIIQAFSDAMMFTSHASFGIIEENKASLALLAPGFLACILMIHETQHVVSIRIVQSPEHSDLSGMIQSLVDALLSIPGLARITSPHPKAALLAFVVVTGLFTSILFPTVTLWLIGTVYSSIWWPQIIKSARRNLRKPLSKRYVLGTSLCRQFFVLYFLGCPENVVRTGEEKHIWILVAMMALQVVVLFLQEYLGPAFFLPSGWRKGPVHDYHPVMSLPDPETPEQSLGDCSICMDPIYVHFELGDERVTRLKAAANRRTYAVAPCHHLFHTRCLVQWMSVKSICPHCRRGLPAL